VASEGEGRKDGTGYLTPYVTHPTPFFSFEENTWCFKNSFTALKAYINLFRGHVQCF
jgi:hypothetical protein